PGNQFAGWHPLAVRDIELAYMAIEEGNGIALVIREDIRYDDDRPSLRPTRDRPIGDPVGSAGGHGVQGCAAAENDVDGVVARKFHERPRRHVVNRQLFANSRPDVRAIVVDHSSLRVAGLSPG